MARMEKDEALGFAKEHGFKILPRSPRGYAIDHDDWKNGQAIPANTYAAALIIMKSFIADQNELIGPADGGNPVAIEAAAKSVAVIQGEFDDLVARADGLRELEPHSWVQQSGRGSRVAVVDGSSPIAERLKLDELPTIAERKTVSRDPRQFKVTVRFKGGERKTYECRDREDAFETAAFQLTGARVKSIKLEPM